jgi:hypothetical protein
MMRESNSKSLGSRFALLLVGLLARKRLLIYGQEVTSRTRMHPLPQRGKEGRTGTHVELTL